MFARNPRAAFLLLVPALLAVGSLASRAQTQPPSSGGSVPFWRNPNPPPPGSSTPGLAPKTPATTSQQQQQQALPANAQVIARVDGRPITQADFDRIADPYFERLRGELGAGFEGDIKKIANHNVFDELLRRELLAIEAQRQKIEVSLAEADALLQQDPFFLTDGKFDPVKFNQYKSSPSSNYTQVLPKIQAIAATNKLDEQLRRKFTPTPAAVRAEWDKRNDQVRFKMLQLLVRDMSLEGEASPEECAAYYAAHPDQFMRRTRVRVRYARLPLPPASDSTRAAEEATAVARAKAIADSLRARTLPDTAAELLDTGLFDVPAPFIPNVGNVPELAPALAQADSDASLRVLGPTTITDAVFVGVIVEREPKHVPPLSEVLGDVKRRADQQHRREKTDADKLAFYDAHRDGYKGPRTSLTRISWLPTNLTVKTPSPAEIERWYATHAHTLYGLADTSKAWIPPLTDSLRAVVRGRLEDEQRQDQAATQLGKVAAGLRSGKDARGLARGIGAAAETLSFVHDSKTDTLFAPLFIDSLLKYGTRLRGQVQGPRLFIGRWVVWRVDAADSAFTPTYEMARTRVDQDFGEERRLKDEADGRAYYEQHRADYKTPVKYAIEYVAVPLASPDSMHIPDAELRKWYDTHLSAYQQEEQVKARHILMSTREGASDAVAKSRADSLLKAIRGGADFIELAKKFSQEPGAATSGGDLGWFGRNRMVKEFEDAAFALKPGELSPVVKSAFGYHIIKVEDRKPAGQRPFDEVKGEIFRQLAQSRADSTARRRADSLRRKLAAGGAAATLAAPYGGTKKTTAFAASDPVPGLGMVGGLREDLPGMTVKKWAAKTYRVANQYLALRSLERVPQRPAEFDEVKPQATEDAKNAKRREIVDRRVVEVRGKLAAGATLDSVSMVYGGLKDSGYLSQAYGFVPGVGNEPRLVTKAFGMKPGQVTDTLKVQAGVVWMRMEERKKADASTFKSTEPQLTQEMTKKNYDDWVEREKKTVKVEVLRPDLREPRPSPFKTVTMSTG
jgi:parvulin-like peptidyl-prolyl isomerase